MAYNNVNKRVVDLHKKGYLELAEIDDGSPNIHSRRDYKLSVTGMNELIRYLISNYEYLGSKFEILSLIKYMDEFGLDKQHHGFEILRDYINTTMFVKEYLEHIKLHEVVPTRHGIYLHEIIPSGFGKVLHELVDIVDKSEAISKMALTKHQMKSKLKLEPKTHSKKVK